jgi:hypothetical protein
VALLRVYGGALGFELADVLNLSCPFHIGLMMRVVSRSRAAGLNSSKLLLIGFSPHIRSAQPSEPDPPSRTLAVEYAITARLKHFNLLSDSGNE